METTNCSPCYSVVTFGLFHCEFWVIDASVHFQIWIPQFCIQIFRGVSPDLVPPEIFQLLLSFLDFPAEPAGTQQCVQEENKPQETSSS